MNKMGKIACAFLCLAAVAAPIAAFAAGTLPAGYTEVEYIQGNGTNARILTDYTPNPATDKIEAVVEFPSLDATMNVWCARGSTPSTATWSLFVLNSSGYKFRFDYNNTAGNYATTALSANTKYTVTADGPTFTWSGGTGASHTKVDAFTATGGPIALFASYYDGTDNHKDYYGKQKLYSFKVWRSGELIHYFVPCKDLSDNATMVDLCENPATLTRSGTFSAGTAGHYYDDSLIVSPDLLRVDGTPSRYGMPSPAYGNLGGLVAGETRAVSCGSPVMTNATGTCVYSCTGWKLYDEDGSVVSNGTETSFTYTHPSPAAFRNLEWQWEKKLAPTNALPIGGAAFHVDASLPLTMTTVAASNGRQLVTEWRDADGGAMKATAGTGSRPWIGMTNGLPYVDFGAQQSGSPSTSTDVSGYLAWSSSLSTIREVFLVFSDYPGSKHSFFLGAGNSYHFHRNQKKLFDSQYASTYVQNGLIEVDGVERAISYELPEGFHLIHLRTTGNVTASNFARDRANINYGGQRLREVVVYTKTLTDDEGEAVCDYLHEKWFNNESLLVVGASPEQFGSPSPDYGIFAGLVAGDTRVVSCGEPEVTNAVGVSYICVGWKLYDADGNVVSNGTETSFAYTHPSPGEYRRLEWQWVEPMSILPIRDQICMPGVVPKPGFTFTNVLSSTSWTFAEDGVAPSGCLFEASYSRVGDVGTVTVTGKAGEGYEDVTVSRCYAVTDELLVNGGFESGAWSPGWTASGNYAAIGNSSSGYQPNYGGTFISGAYCAILQKANIASQVFTNDAPWCAELSWNCKQRSGAAGVPYAVLIDGEEIFSDPLEAATSAIHYQTVGDIVLLPGEHTLTFQTFATADRTLFLDNVSLHVVSTNSLAILPIPNQNCAEGACRPEFVVSNRVDGQTWTVGGDIVSPLFDVAYSNNAVIGTATVTATGKGALAGEVASSTFGILEDDAVSTSDASVRRINVGGDLVYIFTNALAQTTLTTKRGLFLSDALVVGGGGAGGINFGGGGGGGGVIAIDDIAATYAPGETFSFTIGAGGRPSTSTAAGNGRSGGNSALTLGEITYTAKGGGGGGNVNQANGIAGGSGGGGTKTGSGGAGTAGQGYAGAAGSGNSLSGGGGGAGHAGYVANTTDNRAGNGGEGVTNDITGVWTYYGGGGGGGGSGNGNGLADPGYGGLGGGGNGGKDTVGQNGADGFGGGGGGAGYDGDRWGSIGGTGTVILRFKEADFDIESIPCQALVPGGARPDPVVRLIGSSTVLTKDVDYTVSYTDNDALGSSLMTVTGIGSYDGKMGYAGFAVVDRYYVKPSVAVEGDGSSWATAMSVTNFFATCGEIVSPCEVWIASGTVPAAAITVTNNASLLEIRGGFAGTETTIAERPAGALTTFDGEHAVDCLLQIVSTNASAVLELDRLHFCNARANGVIKTGAGSLRVVDCLIAANGLDNNSVYGRGMNVQGGGAGALVVRNCIFAGNMNSGNCGGFGLYLNSMGSALVEDSLFVTNGVPGLTAPKASGNCGTNARGSAIYADGVPVTVRGCRFAGNRGPIRYSTARTDWGGGVVMLNGACGGSLIENCAFIGNTDRLSGDGYDEVSTAGALVIYLANTTDKVTVNNCTFAYNLTQATGNSAGGITAVKGDVEVVNTILWKNRYSYTKWVGYGSDVQIKKDATMTIRNSIVTTLDGTAIVSATPANLTIDTDTVVAADPKLVTTTADYEALVDTSGTRHYYKTTSADAMAAMDAHLLSPAGYVVNGGVAGPATADYSPAIDFGDPDADYSNEPLPNGSRLNVGAYGNTAEASLTSEGQPNVDVDILFPDGMTRPLIQVTMGLESGAAYHGTVHLVCSTGDVVLATKDWDGVSPGDVLTLLLPYYLANGTAITAVATVVAPGATTVGDSATAEANGSYPPFYGKGGGPNVIHVRTGADCLQNGTSWTDAYPDLRTALASAPDASKTEIWLSVTNDYMNAAVTLVGSITVRGGFAGTENSPAERPEGLLSTLDGVSSKYKTMEFSVPSGALLTVERIRFSHSSDPELKKSGSGNLVVRDCLFTDSRTDGPTLHGRGVYATGGTVSITNCQFRNLIGPNVLNSSSYGGTGLYLGSCTRAYVDDCLFVTNGTAFNYNRAAQARHRAAAVFADATPTIFRNCRFAACSAAMYEVGATGGIVYFAGASGGSKLVNCVVTGNTDLEGSSSPQDPTSGGAVVCNMATADDALDIENCTIAYNLTQGKWTGAGLTVCKGTVNLKNSIVYGNYRNRQSDTVNAGADIEVKANGTLNMSYTFVTGLASNYVNAVSGGVTNIGAGVVCGDPLLVTSMDDFTGLFTTDKNGLKYLAQSSRDACAAFDVHLLSPAGSWINGRLEKRPHQLSPAIDAGDPKSDYSREPVVPGFGGNGHRVNLGAYGNTPEAALSFFRGSVFIVR